MVGLNAAHSNSNTSVDVSCSGIAVWPKCCLLSCLQYQVDFHRYFVSILLCGCYSFKFIFHGNYVLLIRVYPLLCNSALVFSLSYTFLQFSVPTVFSCTDFLQPTDALTSIFFAFARMLRICFDVCRIEINYATAVQQLTSKE